MPSIYEILGVDPSKKTVKEIFAAINDNEYPGAFVNIVTDPFCAKRVMTQHQDGDGSKFVQRLLHYFESGDELVFRGMVDDALSMNTSDIAASGFVQLPWIITDVLNLSCPKELKNIIMRAVALRLAELKELYRQHGIKIMLLGGETADVPDQVRSGVFDIGITAWAKKDELIAGNVQAGDIIYGLPSNGRAIWEIADNSGIMDNGLTLGRSALMSDDYNRRYPNLRRDSTFYKGRFPYNGHCGILGEMTVGEALTSPTRQWALVIRKIVLELKSANALHMLHGISINTGGGATKITNVGCAMSYVKRMPPPPPIFSLIQSESGETWENMYQSFNCGVGVDIIGENNPIFAEALKKAVAKCGLPVYRLGICLKRENYSGIENEVSLETPFGEFKY